MYDLSLHLSQNGFYCYIWEIEDISKVTNNLSIHGSESKPYYRTLHRDVNKKVRYYSLKIYPTLFEEVILERSFGSVKNKKPTRVIKEYFSHIENAFGELDIVLRSKLTKGYIDYKY